MTVETAESLLHGQRSDTQTYGYLPSQKRITATLAGTLYF